MNLSLPAFFDIIIGLTFIYLILSLLASEIQELFAALLQFRAKHLRDSISIMLDGKDEAKNLTKDLYENYLIASLSQSSLGFSFTNLSDPSYIPSETFASAFLDILKQNLNVSNETNIVDETLRRFNPATNKPDAPRTTPDAPGTTPDAPEEETLKIPKKLKHYLYELAERAKLKAEINNKEENKEDQKEYYFKKEIEKWYNRSQNRTSGTYKRNSKFSLFLIGLITAFFANANAFHIVSSLYHQATVRNIVTQAAVKAIANCKQTGSDNQECLKTLDTTIEETLKADQLPIGWKFSSPSPTPSPTASPSNTPSTTESPTASPSNTPSTTESPTNSSLKGVGINFSVIQLRNKAIHFLGWIISAFAIMMGAPFWFDLLNKFVNVRNAGPRPTSSPQSSSSTES